MNERGHDELMSDVDIAVVGSGIAGLFLANRCAEEGLNVALVTKKSISTSNTNWAQGGIAGVLEVAGTGVRELLWPAGRA